jgi:hypothetical protein
MSDPKMIKWVKPNKVEVETNDLPATVAEAERLKWKRVNVKMTAAEKKAAKDAEEQAAKDAEEQAAKDAGNEDDL